MGLKSTLPIFISPAAMAKLGHPLGEVNLTKGAGRCGIVQGVSQLGSTGSQLVATICVHRSDYFPRSNFLPITSYYRSTG